MNIQSKLKITTSLSPYDVSVLILIYLYCCNQARIPAKIFTRLITPTIPPAEAIPILEKDFHGAVRQKPLLPVLESLVSYLFDSDERQLATELVSFIGSIKSLDVVTQLLRTLEHSCLGKNYRFIGSKQGESKLRRLTKTSFLGAYVVKCVTNYQVSEFEERRALWQSMGRYFSDFKSTGSWRQLEKHIKQISFQFMTGSERYEEDDSMITFFESFCQTSKVQDRDVVMIGYSHLQSLLNWAIIDMSENKSELEPSINNILSMLSLNEITHFPAIHVIRYLEAIKNNFYQTALDALHNYFDYMLTRSDNKCFHVSLLCLGTFHSQSHNCAAAVKAFEEATKVARENKDSETLNLIMIWVVDFIEKNPEYSGHFQVTVDQIVRYLKTCNDDESCLVFEHAYKFESLLLMMDNSSSVKILEAAFKYLVIVLQRIEVGSNLDSAFKHWAGVWEHLGYNRIGEVYRAFIRPESSSINTEIRDAFKALDNNDLDDVLRTLSKSNSPNLEYDQRKQISLLGIRYLIALEDYPEAMRKVYQNISEARGSIVDSRWIISFELEKCRIMLARGVAARCLGLLMELINASFLSENPLRFSECLILLCEILLDMDKRTECLYLLRSNLSVALQFPELEYRVSSILSAI
ncbi:hypothetical protein HG536_0A07900 [Torulaspora globosa]|uniref:Anaphase-promoting complex subunit 5 n=1 Tax=Torulaspora globosa TaxID=48254 RepID=A0A7G3ZBT9_9SACH|nr:uncharacterized protein HG536_0A07900 [Torulaspora globosa]QLL30975.1 hypothetical protein HG536_0A07900 [Torulaspora globosa]